MQVEALERAAATAKKTKSPKEVPDFVTMSKADLERMTKVCDLGGGATSPWAYQELQDVL